jgi:RNA polymerase-associated protein CTR9
LEKSGGDEFNLLCCLGRVWLLRGREEKNADFIRISIDYTRRVCYLTVVLMKALNLQPDNGNVKFNIAFDQFQLADVLRETDPSKRTVLEVETAATDLEAAIEYVNYNISNIVLYLS